MFLGATKKFKAAKYQGVLGNRKPRRFRQQFKNTGMVVKNQSGAKALPLLHQIRADVSHVSGSACSTSLFDWPR